MNTPTLWVLLRAPAAAAVASAPMAAGDAHRVKRSAAQIPSFAFASDCAGQPNVGFDPAPPHRSAGGKIVGLTRRIGPNPGAPRYQWQCDGIVLGVADRACVALPTTALTHVDADYSVVFDDGVFRTEHRPAVRAVIEAAHEPPWNWADIAGGLRAKPDLYATVFVAFKDLCTGISLQA